MSIKKDTIVDSNDIKTVGEPPVKEVVKRVGKDHIKYVVLLKLLNAILVNIGKDVIDDVTKFMDIDRTDIIKQGAILDNMQEELFPLFSKRDCGYNRKTKNMPLNVLRGMMKEVGYNLEYVKKDIYVVINGENYRKSHTFYSIK